MRVWAFTTYLSLFLFSFVFTITIVTFMIPPVPRLDFSIYMLATKLATLHQPLYPLLYGGAPFTYPPSIFLLFIPFLLFPLGIATSIWNGISVLGILVSVLLLTWESRVGFKPAYILLLLSGIFLLEPVRETLLFGQNNTIVLLYCVLAFIFSRERPTTLLGGIFLGIASALKVFPLFLVVYFLAQKQWKNVIATGIIFVFFLLCGTFGHLRYIADYISYAHLVMTPVRVILEDQSLPSLLLLILPALRPIHTEISLMIFGIFTAFSYLLWKKSTFGFLSDFLFFSEILGASILLVTPLAWVHHLVFLIPLSLGLFFQAFVTKSKKNIALFVLVFLLIFMNSGDINLLFLRLGWKTIPFLSFHAMMGLTVALVVRSTILVQ